MLVILSPAKKIVTDSYPPQGTTMTRPQFLRQTKQLHAVLKDMSTDELAALMSISDSLAKLNEQRYRQWRSRINAASRCAIFLFHGDVYQGLDAGSMSVDDTIHAQKHLRILSGLYGLLRPMDGIMPYRLEMGTQLRTEHAVNLYSFWSKIITDAINSRLRASGKRILVNLASHEYSNAVRMADVAGTVITPVFKDYSNGSYKVISFLAKKARGYMTRYMIDARIRDAEQLKQFCRHGYRFDAPSSTDTSWVFVRRNIA